MRPFTPQTLTRFEAVIGLVRAGMTMMALAVLVTTVLVPGARGALTAAVARLVRRFRLQL